MIMVANSVAGDAKPPEVVVGYAKPTPPDGCKNDIPNPVRAMSIRFRSTRRTG